MKSFHIWKAAIFHNSFAVCITLHQFVSGSVSHSVTLITAFKVQIQIKTLFIEQSCLSTWVQCSLAFTCLHCWHAWNLPRRRMDSYAAGCGSMSSLPRILSPERAQERGSGACCMVQYRAVTRPPSGEISRGKERECQAARTRLRWPGFPVPALSCSDYQCLHLHYWVVCPDLHFFLVSHFTNLCCQKRYAEGQKVPCALLRQAGKQLLDCRQWTTVQSWCHGGLLKQLVRIAIVVSH